MHIFSPPLARPQWPQLFQENLRVASGVGSPRWAGLPQLVKIVSGEGGLSWCSFTGFWLSWTAGASLQWRSGGGLAGVRWVSRDSLVGLRYLIRCRGDTGITKDTSTKFSNIPSLSTYYLFQLRSSEAQFLPWYFHDGVYESHFLQTVIVCFYCDGRT